MTDRDALADSVTAVRFPSARFRHGYSAGDVDASLTDLATTIRASGPVWERVALAGVADRPRGLRCRLVYSVIARVFGGRRS